MLSSLVPLFGLALAGSDLTAHEIVRRSDEYHRLQKEKGEVVMVLQSKAGEELKRQYEYVATQKDSDPEGDMSVIRFTAPSDIKDTSILTVDGKAFGEDQQWLYLPSFRKTRRLGNADLGDRFVGSDVYYRDLKRFWVNDYAYKLLGNEAVDGQPCYIIEALPMHEKVVKYEPYSKRVLWIRQDNFFITRVRIFDRRGQPLKEVSWTGLTLVQGKSWRPERITLVDIQRSHRTMLIYRNREVAFDLPPDQFSKHKLGEGSR